MMSSAPRRNGVGSCWPPARPGSSWLPPLPKNTNVPISGAGRRGGVTTSWHDTAWTLQAPHHLRLRRGPLADPLHFRLQPLHGPRGPRNQHGGSWRPRTAGLQCGSRPKRGDDHRVLQAVWHAPSRFRADLWHSKGLFRAPPPSGPLLSQAAGALLPARSGCPTRPEIAINAERCKTKRLVAIKRTG